MKSTPQRRRAVPGLARAIEGGPRVFLRLPTPRDEPEFTRLRRASRAFLKRWEPLLPGGRSTFGRALFPRFLKGSRTKDNRKLLVCFNDDGAIIGQVSLNNIIRGPFQSCFLGHWICQSFARQGYTTEAIGLVLRLAFETMELHRVEANIMPVNKPSKGLIRKLGFRFEGRAKRYLQIAGKWEDHEHWAMTVEEWKETPSPATSLK